VEVEGLVAHELGDAFRELYQFFGVKLVHGSELDDQLPFAGALGQVEHGRLEYEADALRQLLQLLLHQHYLSLIQRESRLLIIHLRMRKSTRPAFRRYAALKCFLKDFLPLRQLPSDLAATARTPLSPIKRAPYSKMQQLNFRSSASRSLTDKNSK
jgi:hypothetical protein